MRCQRRSSWGSPSLVAACAAAILLTSTSEAQQRPRPNQHRLLHGFVSPAALRGGNAPIQGGIAGMLLGSWCFEEAEGFSPGWLDGRGGWEVAASAATLEPKVSTTNPDTGAQAVRFTYDPGLPTAMNLGQLQPLAFSPNLGAQPEGEYTLTLRFFVSALGGSDYLVVPQSPAQGFVVTYLDIGFDGTILALEATGKGLAFVEVGPYTIGEYHELTLVLESATGAIEYSLDGIPIHTGASLGATTIEQVVLTTDNFDASSTADFDCITIAAAEPPPPCPGDLDGSAAVGVGDLLALIGLWGTSPEDANWNPAADLNGDGVIGIGDLLALIANWGPCTP